MPRPARPRFAAVVRSIEKSNFPKRLPMVLALVLSFSLLMSSLVWATPTSVAASGQRKGHPEPGAPSGMFPNLDQVRRKHHEDPQAPEGPRSLLRGRRKSLEPRSGRRVGDGDTQPVGLEPLQSNITAGRGALKREAVSVIKQAGAAKFHHAGRAGTSSRGLVSAPPPISDNDYVQRWFSYALNRSGNSTESGYWNDLLRAAYAHAQTSMVMSSRELGKTLFESAEYAARNRSNHDYVYDLYQTYFMRNPDSGGWSYWEGLVPSVGRENVRRAFDESPEFATKVATVTLTGSASSSVTSLLTARVDLGNQSGNQLLARDAEWSLPIVSVPGRGLDLGLALSYSSAAVWTRSGPYIYFDDDNSSISPGFRLGFPAVQELFFNAQTGQNAYLLITSAGARVELRQVGTTNVYEAADSSHLQLTDTSSSDGKLLLRSADGTMIRYTKLENEWRCNQVKDRNGNYLTVNYNALGDITSVVETLGRTINFVYDANANLTEINQTWHRDLQTGGQSNEVHKWATFGWGSATIQPGSLVTPAGNDGIISGIANGQSIPVLTMVGLPDATYYKFAYTSWNSGEVARITHYASDSNPAYDNHERAHKVFTYSASSDVTRLTDSRVAAENWTGLNGVASEVTTQFGFDGGSAYWLTDPNGTVYKEFYGTGWQKRLVQQTETWSADGTKQKWTSTTWTQDNTGVAYLINPRVTETNVYDASGNRRRTGYDYVTSFNLPQCVIDYAANASTVIRYTCLGYNTDTAYTSRRIIGLPSIKNVFDGNWTFFSKTTYEYDWNSGYMSTEAPSMQHDTTNYGSTFSVGRGVLTGVRRYNSNYPTDDNQASWVVQRGYNLAGDITFTRDAAGHQTNISYADNFSDGNNSRNTLAYPTQVKDPDWNASTAPNNYSTAQYNFDLGVAFRVQGPPPKDPITGAPYSSWGAGRTYYDIAGRTEMVKNEFNSGYSRFVYGPYYVQNYTSVNTAGDDRYAIQTFDGAGRVVGAASNNPNSTGGYKAQLNVYNQVGQLQKQSNPAEITPGWVPTGDDAGWLYTNQTYDWKGRPLVTTNADSTSTRSLSYGGCGCAGGEVLTLTDEVGRKQKLYSDVLGRTAKTEIYESNGTTVYSSATNKYNTRDHVTRFRQYVGAAPEPEPETEGSGYQTTTSTFDGYGRLWTRHAPEQQVDPLIAASTDHTTYLYNADDTASSVTDARGVTMTLGYNGRHLLTTITYPGSQSLPASVAPSANISYDYDSAGNRKTMDDAMGHVEYSYDQLSRLQWENRHFNTVSNPNSTDHNYKLSYSYNFAGNLTGIIHPSGAQVSYVYDATSRLTDVTGSAFSGVTTYASNIKYRAWGDARSALYGNSSSASTTYDSRMQPVQYQLTGTYTLREQYQYYADGRMQKMNDLDDTTDTYQGQFSRHFSRTFSYDQAARVKAVKGIDASGQYTLGFPFTQDYQYDAFDNLTSRVGSYYYQPFSNEAATYQNSRRSDWTYDANGQVTQSPTHTGSVTSFRDWQYDASGQMVQAKDSKIVNNQTTTTTYTSNYDGDGQLAYETSFYLLRSSVTGEVVTRITSAGLTLKNVLSVDGMLTAVQLMDANGLPAAVQWVHTDPYGLSEGTSAGQGKAVYDPLGNYVPQQPWPLNPPPSFTGANPPGGGPGGSFGFTGSSSHVACTLDGAPMDCNRASRAIANDKGSVKSIKSNFLDLAPFGVFFALELNTKRIVPEKHGPYPQAPPKFVPHGPRQVPQSGPGGSADSEGASRLYLDQITVSFSLVLFQPQNSGFRSGRFGFDQQESDRLASAFDRINRDMCHKFFNDTLANLRKQGKIASGFGFTPTTLQGVLDITTLNKYSPTLTAREVGVTQGSWDYVQSKFANPEDGKYASGVTLADGRVFLGDNAFYQPGIFAGLRYNTTDLSGVIVHEFFHRAGLSEPQIQALHKDIQANCGIPGFAL